MPRTIYGDFHDEIELTLSRHRPCWLLPLYNQRTNNLFPDHNTNNILAHSITNHGLTHNIRAHKITD